MFFVVLAAAFLTLEGALKTVPRDLFLPLSLCMSLSLSVSPFLSVAIPWVHLVWRKITSGCHV